MSQTPFDSLKGLLIGTVDFVAPNEIKVILDINAPESVALNAGGVRPFPRVNGYVLVSVDDAFLVAQIEWLTIERSAFPKRHGVRDFGVIDLPYPLRKMSANPVGTLRKKAGQDDDYTFTRGADALPSVGSSVLLPTEKQLQAIVESGERRRVYIGTSPLAANAKVSIDPDRLFGRHLAVLGNTGSGKSCSVAGLIRWSLEAAKEAKKKQKEEQKDGSVNARFIIIDPNGEYARAFSKNSDLKARVFEVKPDNKVESDNKNKDENKSQTLKVPLWFWNSAEWASFTQASAKTQRPALVQALRMVKDKKIDLQPSKIYKIRRFLRTIESVIRNEHNSQSPYQRFPKSKNFYQMLEGYKKGLVEELESFPKEEHNTQNDTQHNKLKNFVDTIEGLCKPRRTQYPGYIFTPSEVEGLLHDVSEARLAFGGSDSDVELLDADSPIPFSGDNLIRCVEAAADMMRTSEHVETLLVRIRSLLADNLIKKIMDDSENLSLEAWLNKYIGKNENDGQIAILNLSLVPSEVIHIVTAVVARMIFEALQRYRKLNDSVLPTVLVMEEAHTFVRRYKTDTENTDTAAICCQVFERIAREGRKFGLGLVLSSQRPSELSQTVLSQCNTFLLHRMSNERDQDLVNRFVPDNLRGLLRELPTLPSQQAILLGWASELPILTRMRDLPEHHRPHSEDPDFWNVWTSRNSEGESVSHPTDWGAIARDWQYPSSANNKQAEK